MSRVLPSIKRVVPLYGEIRVSETAFPPIACLSMYIETTYFAPNIYRIRIIERVISFLLSSFSFFCGIIDIALSVSSYIFIDMPRANWIGERVGSKAIKRNSVGTSVEEISSVRRKVWIVVIKKVRNEVGWISWGKKVGLKQGRETMKFSPRRGRREMKFFSASASADF